MRRVSVQIPTGDAVISLPLPTRDPVTNLNRSGFKPGLAAYSCYKFKYKQFDDT